MRYVYDVFSGVQQTTIGSSFVERNVTVESSEYKLRLWDTAGQERFDALTGFYARGARAVIICYDMTDRETCARLARPLARAPPCRVRCGTQAAFGRAALRRRVGHSTMVRPATLRPATCGR